MPKKIKFTQAYAYDLAIFVHRMKWKFTLATKAVNETQQSRMWDNCCKIVITITQYDLFVTFCIIVDISDKPTADRVI